MARMIPYSYQAGTSPLHTLPASLKLGFYLVLSTASFISGTVALAAGGTVVLAGALVARISPSRLLAGSGPLFLTVSLVVLLRTLRFTPFSADLAGFRASLRFAAAVAVAYSGGAVLFAVTTTGQLRDSLARLEVLALKPVTLLLGRIPGPRAHRLLDRLDRQRVSLGVALMLSFLPRIFEIWDGAEDAYRARLGKPGLRHLMLLLPLVTERLMESAVETAYALEARGHSDRAANRRASSSACIRDE